MKLFVIVRDTHGEIFAGVINGNIKSYSGVRDLVPESLTFEMYRKINRKEDVPNVDKFWTVSEFRKIYNNDFPVKFSQIILDQLGFDRIWLYKDNML